MNKKISDTGASVRQRLLNLARKSNRPFNEILQYYMIERFIYRLSKSSYRRKLILKGALMFIAWDFEQTRPTRDIDLLGKTSNKVENIAQIIKGICQIECLEDATYFLTDTIECIPIQQRNEYQGIRVCFSGELAKCRTRMQIDIGFGDIIFPNPCDLIYPSLLGMSSSAILGYTPESVIAEKLHAMIKLGLANSRIKDYFDVWFLSQQFAFDGYDLSEAINRTFLNRKMMISDVNTNIFQQIGNDDSRQLLWKAFVKKNQLIFARSFHDVTNLIALFTDPIFDFHKKNKEFRLLWKPPGPWK